MSTELVHEKKRKKVKSIVEIYQWAKDEIVKAGDLYLKRKSQIILETAKKLEEADIEKHTICREIVKNLKGFVNDKYVREVLEEYPEYKDEKHVDSAKNRTENRAKRAQIQQIEYKPGYLNEEHDCYKDEIIKQLEQRISQLEGSTK